MTKCGGECKSPWFITHCCFCTLHTHTVLFLSFSVPTHDGFIKGVKCRTSEKPKKRKLKIFLERQTIWEKAFGYRRSKKKESIDKNPRLPKGRFKPDPKRINREKPMSKKGHSLSFRLCVAALFLPFQFQICIVSESCFLSLGSWSSLGYQMHRSCLLSIKLSSSFCSHTLYLPFL